MMILLLSCLILLLTKECTLILKVVMQSNILNIGIVAHVDAGKTTLTEQLLFQSGAIKKLGSVNKGTTISDNLSLERQRGITIQSSSVAFEWGSTKVNLIDTPGHIDFSAEVDRAMSVLDGVVLVISAVEGVQAHSLTLWETIKELNIPVIVFINKIDRAGADPSRVFFDMQQEFNMLGFCINYPLADTTLKPYTDGDTSVSLIDGSYENLADIDEDILEHYLEGTLSTFSPLAEILKNNILSNNIVPVHFGIAKEGLGIADLAETMCNMPSRSIMDSSEVRGQIFKIEHHPHFGKLAHLRIFSGTLEPKASVPCQRLGQEIKINQLLQKKTAKFEVVTSLSCNDVGIAAISEQVVSGDILGSDVESKTQCPLTQSVLSVTVESYEETDYQTLAGALQRLDIEDPALDFIWDKQKRKFRLKIIGPMQIEVLQHILQERFSLEVRIEPPEVEYKETVLNAAEATVRYTMPKPCWAVMTFRVEPGELNSGVHFESSVRVDDISLKYQNEVARALPWALQQGIKGWPVTDIKITLLAGEEHTVHSNPGDFLLATPMGVLKAIKKSGTSLLEPFYDFDIKAPLELLGDISHDLTIMKADMEQPQFEGKLFSLKGTVSVSKAMDYSIKFNSCCSGKGRLKMKVGGYQACEVGDEKIRDYQGVSPLAREQWILHNRGALKADARVR